MRAKWLRVAAARAARRRLRLLVLWHEVIGDQNSNPAVASGCAQALSACVDCTTNAPCGAEEPYLGAQLAASELCVLQRWIDQGALDN
jgi:hypothetical protein